MKGKGGSRVRDYQLKRSNRKTMSLEITEELIVLVRAPLHTPMLQIERFVREQEDWVNAHMERCRHWKEAHPEPTEEERRDYIRRAKAYLPERIAYYSRIIGVTPTAVSITNAKKRFGSCSGKNRICFAWRLMLYPEAAIDYVVVHELAHIRHKDHGAAFYQLIASVMPDYKERVKLLKQ